MRFIIPLIATIVAACGVSANPINDDPWTQLWRARANFQNNLVPALDHLSGFKNVVVSPFGLHSALSSVLAGAQGETYKQLWTALG
mgnify:CR=1 FL=1